MLYDIMVYEEDEGSGGGMIQKSHAESAVSANSAKELISLYKACGSNIKIIREYPDPKEIQIKAQETIKKNETTIVSNQQPNVEKQNNNTKNANSIQINNKVSNETIQPRYFNVGGIDCKQIGSKIYQKQWVTLSKSDLDNFRVLSDKNNKIFSLDGKHVEVKKWILVEDSDTYVENELQLLND